MFRFKIGKFSLHYDRDYGIDCRSGWSLAWDGSFLVQFAPTPVHAIIKSFCQ